MAVDRNHVTVIPKGDDRLLAGYHLFAICDPAYATTFFGLAGKYKGRAWTTLCSWAAAGVGRFVAEAMAATARVKIIEQDLSRAERLAELLLTPWYCTATAPTWSFCKTKAWTRWMRLSP